MQAVAALTYAQSLYTLPVSLFGMSVSAAELPAMSSALGSREAIADQLRHRLDDGLRRIAFFIVPSVIAMMVFGDVMTGALYQTGRFNRADSTYVWGILAGSAVGLLASTLSRLYASTYYALRDTRTPLRFAAVRVALTTVLGYTFAIPLPLWLGIAPRWGAAGLTAAIGLAALLPRPSAAQEGRQFKDAWFWGLLIGFAMVALVAAFFVAQFLGLVLGLLVGLILGSAFMVAIWKSAPPGVVYLEIAEDGEAYIVSNPSWT